MPQKTILKAKGLYTDPNQLSGTPEGSLSIAENVIIDRNDTIEPRRGFAQYGNTFGTENDRANQLLTYKNRILVHYNNTLLFNNSPHTAANDGDFQAFDGTFEEVTPDLRIKAAESNKNLYFTTADGIKKISAVTAADFTTAADFIIDSGAAKALDVSGTLNSNNDGFLLGNSEVGYRIVWGYKDPNDNLLLGSPSSRVVITNFNTTSANVDLTFAIPQNVTTDYFYQVYRTATFTATGSLTLDDIDPGDEMKLVIEDFPTTSQLSDGIVTVTDLSPEDFRQGGLPLYTNPNSGDGIEQANEPPPIAKDITMYQSTLFYANTESRARTTLSLLSVSDLVDGTSAITIDDGINDPNTYTFVGEKETTRFDFTAYSGAIPADLDGTYALFNSAGDERKYYLWFDNTKTTQTIDFTNYNGVIPDDLDGTYFVLYTQNPDLTYYVWFDSTGTTTDPGPSDEVLTGYSGIRVDISSGVTTTTQLANATQAAITAGDIDGDFDVTYGAGTSFTVDTEAFDSTSFFALETIQKGFSYDIDTPVNSDPINDTVTNFDVLGRSGIRVNVSRGVTTTADVADAAAAAILDQDTASDFDVSYTTSNDFFDFTTENNGDTTDAVDSAINPIGNSFAITVTQQGNGAGISDGTITAIGIGATSTVTSTAHGLADGDVVNISGSDSTPSIDGRYVISGVTLNTYDIVPSAAVTVAGTAGTWKQKDVLLSDAASPAQQIDQTARSIVSIVNKDPDSPVYAFYISGASDLPGQILFEVKDIGTNQFTITADNGTTGDLFNPSLPPSANAKPVIGEAEIKPNRIYYAKLQQPEAVPILNFIDVGPEDKAISRILSLRESLFLLKEDGVYRLTGLDGNFAVDLFDESTKIIAPDSAVVLNNQIYCLTNQGIVTISDTGVSIISSQIDGDIKLLSSANYNFESEAFGVSYETDRAYLLFMPTNTTDTVATQAYRYNSENSVWTKYILSKTCGLVNPADDKLYFGAADVNFVERERKIFKRTDYADRQFDLTIPAEAIEGNILTLSSNQLVDVGDAIVQTQYLTINEYNQLLAKLDLDPGTGAPEESLFDFTAYTGSIPNDLHRKYFILFSAGDNTKYAVFYDAVGDVPQLDVNAFSDIRDATQIRVDISSGVTTAADVALRTKSAISTATFDFIVTHIGTNTFLTTRTARNGATTDAFDSLVNGIGNGFAVSVTSQGVGDFVGNLQAVNGDNLVLKLTALAQALDSDPGVNDTDYEAVIGSFSTFEEIQTAFNTITLKLNDDSGVFYQNYLQSSGTKDFEVLVTQIIDNSPDVALQFTTRFIEGPVVLYKGIQTNIVYAPEIFGDTSISKHVSEGTFIFENNNFSLGTVGYRTDLSPGFETIDFTKAGKGDWSLFVWSEHNWGGGFSGVPLRTYIPRQKQRCRYMQAQFLHSSAREAFILYGISYTFRPVSERAYRS